MRRLIIAASLISLAFPALAVRMTPRDGGWITVLAPGSGPRYAFDRSVRGYVPNFLRDELRRSGYQADVADMSFDELQSGQRESLHPTDYYLEVVWSDAGAGDIVEGGGGGPIGNTNVGAGVAIVYAHAIAEMRLYDGRSLHLIDTYHLESTHVGPDLDGIGFFWRYFYISLPIRTNAPLRAAAHDLARQATDRLRGEASPRPSTQR
ncbi:MAG: hypothetical protein ABI718_13810 [Acidobacteriota bacterium]